MAIRVVLAVIVAASKVSAAAPKSKGKTPKPDADGWYSLFNGKDLKGWKASEDNPDTFKVVDGDIVAHGKVCHLYYAGPVNHADFKNFEWKCDVMTKPGSNSGMYFHTKYQPTGFPSTGIECQVDNSHKDPRRTGSLYQLKDIMNDSPAKDNEWFTQDGDRQRRSHHGEGQRQSRERIHLAEGFQTRRQLRPQRPRLTARSPCKATTPAAKSTTRISK